MIILHNEGLIALKARKVGGTSFEIALSKFADKDSIITPITQSDEELRQSFGWRGPQNFKYSADELIRLGKREIAKALLHRAWPQKFVNHISAVDVKEKLGEDTWAKYTKVSITRNPFDYMVSSYFWANKTEAARARLSFESFVLTHPELLLWNKRIHEINGENVIDFMIRYEHFKADILELEEKFPSLKGLAETFTGINAKGNFRPRNAHMSDMFSQSPRAHALVKNVCFDDIVKYGYEIPDLG